MRPLQHVQYIRDPDLGGIEVCRVKDSSHYFPNHFHDHVYAIGLMEKGFSYCLGPTREEALVGTGNIALINPGQVHSGVPAGDSRLNYTMIYISAELMRTIVCDLTQNDQTYPEFERIIVQDPSLFASLELLANILDSRIDLLEKQILITESLSRLFIRHCGIRGDQSSKNNESVAVLRAKELLSTDIEATISLDVTAETARLSRYHFLRVFKKATGISPHAFRTVKRIEASKALIRKGVPISQIALETGFSDQSHFTNTFRNYIGSTPKQYLAGN